MITSRHIAKAAASLVRTSPHDAVRIADQVIEFVRAHHLEGQLPSIMRALHTEADKVHMATTLMIESPFAVPERERHTIGRVLNVPSDAKVHVTENPQLIGGFRAYWRDLKADGSLSHALEKLHATLSRVE